MKKLILILALLFSFQLLAYDPQDLKKLIVTNECMKCDLSAIDMSFKDLSGADLYGANLEDANFVGADLEAANLSRVKAKGANFKGANLKFATLHTPDFTGANFEEADMTGARFEGSSGNFFDNPTIEDANFSGANLSNVYIGAYTISGANFSGANLKRADLMRNDDEDTNFEGAIFCRSYIPPKNKTKEYVKFKASILKELLKELGLNWRFQMKDNAWSSYNERTDQMGEWRTIHQRNDHCEENEFVDKDADILGIWIGCSHINRLRIGSCSGPDDEIISISRVDNQYIARSLTGNSQVRKGEITFKFDLNFNNGRKAAYYVNGVPYFFWVEVWELSSSNFTLKNEYMHHFNKVNLQNGPYEKLYTSGKTMYKGYFRDGEPAGLWNYFDEQGNLIESIEF